MSSKKERGQFYTVNHGYILEGLAKPPPGVRVVEPFAGQGDLLDWLGAGYTCEAYDLEPKDARVKKRDTLLDPPEYTGSWVITNPPYLARNKTGDKTYFEKYDTNDLYKCFMHSLNDCLGGLLIIPVGFFLSPRDVDFQCRHAFMQRYTITHVRCFEEQVFPDTSTAVVAFSFEKATTGPLEVQEVPWERVPGGDVRTFTMRASEKWIIGGDIYDLPVNPGVKITRYVEDQEPRGLTGLTLHALDCSTPISMKYAPEEVYRGKHSSRTYATLCVHGVALTEEVEREIALRFNTYLAEKRKDTWSLFLPQYREFARKRMPFDLAYAVVHKIIRDLKLL
jgi:hypothetical protein